MKVRELHGWDLSIREAMALQGRLAARVRERRLAALPRLVAGVDCGYSRREDKLYAAVVLCRLPRRTPRNSAEVETLEEHVVTGQPRMPYVPGLLSFREAPPLLECLARLSRRPEAVLVDGQGRAHPRRFGIACHLGVIFDKPTIGCAKSLLVGEHEEPGVRAGATTPLMLDGERVGMVLRTREHVKPIYVTTGHRVGLESAVTLVKQCLDGFRIPKPTREADRYVRQLRRAYQQVQVKRQRAKGKNQT